MLAFLLCFAAVASETSFSYTSSPNQQLESEIDISPKLNPPFVDKLTFTDRPYIYIYIHTYIYIYIYQLHIYIYIHTHTCIYTHTLSAVCRKIPRTLKHLETSNSKSAPRPQRTKPKPPPRRPPWSWWVHALPTA